jgi:tetratricopeptide (TPR) repeat protein
MLRFFFGLLLAMFLVGFTLAQVDELPSSPQGPGKNNAPPRSDRDREAESSSKDTKIDLSPPKDDVKNHPYSAAAVSDAEADANPDANSDVQEFHPWDPHKALKDIEVGDFYFRRKNYRAALDRYREALVYKPNDALANFHMGQCFEKLDESDEAVTHYQEYLKILPRGPLSEAAHKAIDKLKASQAKGEATESAQTKQ